MDNLWITSVVPVDNSPSGVLHWGQQDVPRHGSTQFQSGSIPETNSKAGIARESKAEVNSRPPLELRKKNSWNCAPTGQFHNSSLSPLKGEPTRLELPLGVPCGEGFMLSKLEGEMNVDDDLVRRVEVALEDMIEFAHGFANGRQPRSGDHRCLIRSDIERAEKVLDEVEGLGGGEDGK